MKDYTMLLCLSLTTLLGACSTKPPTQEDVVGVWVNPDGATLILNADGSFSAQALPSELFVYKGRPDSQINNVKGSWSLKKELGWWKIRISYEGEVKNETSGYAQTNFSTVANVGGRGDSIYLFLWVGDPDSGIRYRLTRKKKN